MSVDRDNRSAPFCRSCVRHTATGSFSCPEPPFGPANPYHSRICDLSIRRTAIRRVYKGTDNLFIINKGATDMRFMMIVKASKESEAGEMPEEKVLADMAKYNEELVKAGVMLDGAGLKPSSKGARSSIRAASARSSMVLSPRRRSSSPDSGSSRSNRKKRPSSGRSACRSTTAKSSCVRSSSSKTSLRARPSSTTRKWASSSRSRSRSGPGRQAGLATAARCIRA